MALTREQLTEKLQHGGPVFVYGGPTTGKSTLAETSGLPCIDTDGLVEMLMDKYAPGEHTGKWDYFRSHNKDVHDEVNNAVKYYLEYLEVKKVPVIVLSNLWRVRDSWDFAFWRESANMKEMFITRYKAKHGEDPSPERVAEVDKWTQPKFPNLQVLQAGEFMFTDSEKEHQTLSLKSAAKLIGLSSPSTSSGLVSAASQAV